MADGHDYLLDTCVISVLHRPSAPEYVAVRRRFAAIQGQILLPVLALAEIEFGIQIVGAAGSKETEALRRFFATRPVPLPFGLSTIESYAVLRAQLLRDYGTRKQRTFKPKHLHLLLNPETRNSLEIYERDLMIACTAIEYGLILATLDNARGMKSIIASAEKCKANGHVINLQIERWP